MVRTKTAIVVLLLSFLVFFSIGALLLGRYFSELRRASPQNSIYVSQGAGVQRR